VETELVNISQIKKNPSNPRTIKDDKFKKLTQSIKELPQMLFLRPIVVNDDMVVLGGNMRLKACKEAGLKEVPVIKARDLTEDQQREFIIKDNVGFGEWDWDILANEWDIDLLSDWGLATWNTSDVDLDGFFEDDTTDKANINKIVLEYNDEEYIQVVELFDKFTGSKESIIWDLLKA
jgi:hypothetical protein